MMRVPGLHWRVGVALVAVACGRTALDLPDQPASEPIATPSGDRGPSSSTGGAGAGQSNDLMGSGGTTASAGTGGGGGAVAVASDWIALLAAHADGAQELRALRLGTTEVLDDVLLAGPGAKLEVRG